MLVAMHICYTWPWSLEFFYLFLSCLSFVFFLGGAIVYVVLQLHHQPLGGGVVLVPSFLIFPSHL